MSNKLVGSFYFKKTNDFNLIGEFANDQSNTITTECSNKIAIRGNFIGEYRSVWYDTEIHECTLIIDFKPNSPNIYTLCWSEDNTPKYNGEGFLLDDSTLIGFYKGL